MKKLFILVFLLPVFCMCNKRKVNYQTRDYVTVGKMMNNVKAPYIIDIRNGNKRVVLIGCDHTNNPDNPEFKVIDKFFMDLNPQITFNEGGQIADNVHYASRKEAIVKNEETGILKYLSDNSKIKMINGDIADSTEFKTMLKRYPKEKLLLYYIMERLVIPYLEGAYGKTDFEQLYQKAIVEWFVNKGFPLEKNNQTFSYFKEIYKKYVGNDFKLEINGDIEKFDYINDGCEFCALGRASKMLRDSTLLSKIDHALDDFDRIMVTFGQGHAIAIEPALKQIVADH